MSHKCKTNLGLTNKVWDQCLFRLNRLVKLLLFNAPQNNHEYHKMGVQISEGKGVQISDGSD